MDHSKAFTCINLILSLTIALSTTLYAEQITIKSCNVLYDGYYQKWAVGVEKMPLSQRSTLLVSAFNDNQQFQGSDILCFQEWDTTNDVLDNLLTSQGYEYENLSYNGFCTPTKCPDKCPEGLLIAWKINKFVLRKNSMIHKFYDTRTSKNQCRALGVTLESVATGMFLHVVSLHASFIMGYDNRYESVLEQLNTIKNAVNQLPVDAAFICGDFNYNTHSSKELHFPNRELSLEDAQHWLPGLTTAGWKRAQSDIIKTSWPTVFGYTGFETVDYILYTGNATLTSYGQYPENPRNLIKHTKVNDDEGWDYADYFSDHAIISATFEMS